MRGTSDEAGVLASRACRSLVRALLVLGSVCAAVRWGLGPTASVAVVTMIVGVSVGIMIDLRLVGRAVRLAALATGVLLTSGVMLAVLSWSDLVLIVPLVAMSLVLVGRRTREAQAAPQAPERVASWFPEVESQEELESLSDDELCRRWRRSFTALSQAADGALPLDVVRARQLYLDELERRHPAELRTWLASGARAAGNPLPYLSRPPTSTDGPA